MLRLVLSALCALSLIGQPFVPAMAASQPDLKFKIYAPPEGEEERQETGSTGGETLADEAFEAATGSPSAASAPERAPADDSGGSFWSDDSQSAEPSSPAAGGSDGPAAAGESSQHDPGGSGEEKGMSGAYLQSHSSSQQGGTRLQGYIRVVPSGTKIPIIMDTAIDSDTSQEGDEFAARTAEDLNIDGSTVVPAGSVIKGRIAQLNAPRALNRSGSVALKFDTVTTPDNRQIPIVANIVARGGVVHARRGLKDIAFDTGTVALPTALGIGIGALAGNSAASLGMGGGALIGAGVGAAVGVIVLMAKKGKRVDVRPGDELKIELAEDLRMPM